MDAYSFLLELQVMEQTLVMYHRFSVKEMLRVTKMYEAIVPATEFLNMQITPQQVRQSDILEAKFTIQYLTSSKPTRDLCELLLLPSYHSTAGYCSIRALILRISCFP